MSKLTDISNPKDIEFIEEHIANAPKESLPNLKKLRELIIENVPDGIEGLSYAMPTVRYKGKAVVTYFAWKKHIGFYPMGTALIEKYESEIKDLKLTPSKGAIQLPFDKPLPVNFIKKIIKDRIRVIDEK